MSFKIKSRVWIELDGKVLLGEGRHRLLKEIEATGSLTRASKNMKMSYKKAWNLIDSINKTSNKQVTINTVGGKGGGGVKLSPYGKSLMSAFENINKNCWDFLDEQLLEIKNLK